MATTSAGFGLEEISSRLNANGRNKRIPKTVEESQQMQESEDILRYGGSGKGRKFLYGVASAIVGEDNAKKISAKYGNREEQEKAFKNIYGEEKKPSRKKTTEQIPKSELKEYLEELKKALGDIAEIKDIVERIEKRVSPRDVTVGKGAQAQTYRFDPLAPLEKQVTEVNESGLAGSFAGKKETATVLSKAAYFGNQDLIAKKEKEDAKKGTIQQPEEKKKGKKVERKTTTKQTVEQVSATETKKIITEIKQQFKITNKLIRDTAKQKQTKIAQIKPQQITPQAGNSKFNTLEEYDEYQNKLSDAKDTLKYGGAGFGKKLIYGFRQGILGTKYADKKARENAVSEKREEAARLLNPSAFQPTQATTQTQVGAVQATNSQVVNNNTTTENKIDTIVQSTKDIPTVKDGVDRIEKRVSPRDITVGKGGDAQTFRFDPLAPEGKQVAEVKESGLAGSIASKEGGGRSDYEKVLSKAAYLGNQDLIDKKEQQNKVENPLSETPIAAPITPTQVAPVLPPPLPIQRTNDNQVPEQNEPQQIAAEITPEIKPTAQNEIPNIESVVSNQTSSDIKTAEIETKLNQVVDSTKQIPEIGDAVGRVEKRVSPRDITVGKGEDAQTYRFDPLAPEGKQVTEVKESGLAGSFAGQKEEADVLSKAAYLGNQDMVSKKSQQDLRKQEQNVSEVFESKVQAAPQTVVPSVETAIPLTPQVQPSQQIPSKETDEQLEQRQTENRQKTNKLFDEIKQQIIETKKLIVSTKTITKQSGTNPQDKPKFASVEEKDKYDEEVQNAKDVMQYGGTSFTKKFAYGFKAGILGEKFAKKSAAKNANKEEREKAFRLLNPDKVKPAEEKTPPPLPNSGENQTPQTAPDVKPTDATTVPNMETAQSAQQTSSPELEKKVDQVIQSTKDIPTVKDGVDRIEKRVSPRDVTVGKGDDAQTYKFDPLAPQGKQVTEITEAGLAGKFAGKKEEASVLSKAAYFGNQDLVAKKEQEDSRKAQEVSEVPQTSSNILQPTDSSIPATTLMSASSTTIPSVQNTESNTEGAQATNIVAVQKEKAESEKEDREKVIGKLDEIEKKIDKLLSEEGENEGGGFDLDIGRRGLGRAGRVLGRAGRAVGRGARALGRGAASVGRGALSAARAAGPALGRVATTAARFLGPAAAVAGAGYTGYQVGEAIDTGVEKLTGRGISDRLASGVGAITGSNEEQEQAVRSGESSFADIQKRKNERLKGTGYEFVAPGKYKGPDGKIVSSKELPANVQALAAPGAMPNAQGVVEGKIQRPGIVPAAPAAATSTPAVEPTEPATPAEASKPETTPPQPQARSQTPTVAAAAPAMGALGSQSKDKQQEEKITKLTSENAVLRSQQTTAMRRAAKVPRANPPPPPQQKKEKREDVTVIQIRNVEQSVATYTASIFDHPVVHPGIYKM